MVLTYQHLLLDLSEILLQVIIAEINRKRCTFSNAEKSQSIIICIEMMKNLPFRMILSII